uniref:Uncharacterized protein n=1 Tax=Spermophilus dauricus TaxID=99837 RepID=A0A8C9P7A3_SPEDA
MGSCYVAQAGPRLLGSRRPPAQHFMSEELSSGYSNSSQGCEKNIYKEMGSCYVAQAGPRLLGSRRPPAQHFMSEELSSGYSNSSQGCENLLPFLKILRRVPGT